MDYPIGDFVYMLPSDMNLRIGNVRNYNNKILISSPSFKIGTNVKVNIDVKSNEKHKQNVKPNIKFDRESNQDVKKPDLLSSQFNYVEKRSKLNDKITYEEEKVALILGTTAVFTVWWMFS